MGTSRFEETLVWQKAHAWVLGVYKLTSCFPRDELFGLPSHLRRAAVSVPANFAEGYSRRTPSDKARFLNIAQGSLEESRYYLILGGDLGFGDTCELSDQAEEVGRILAACSRSVTTQDPTCRPGTPSS